MASLENFFLIQLLLSLANNLIFNSEFTVTFITWSVLFITLTLRIPKGKVLNICVKLSLIMLTVCKSHFHLYFYMFYW